VKKFRYKWTLGEKEYSGEKKCETEADLKNHLKMIGGTLLAILDVKEIETQVINIDKSAEKPTSCIFHEKGPQSSKKIKKNRFQEPSTGIKVLAGLYCLPTLVGYLFVASGLVSGSVNVNGKIITNPADVRLVSLGVGVIFTIPALLGWGLWKLKKWARIIILVLAWLDIVSAMIAIFYAKISLPFTGIFMIWFLNMEKVKEQFEPE
jgi:hypothetical protein